MRTLRQAEPVVAVMAAMVLAAAMAVTAPGLFAVSVIAAVGLGLLWTSFRHLAAACALWVLFVGMTPEMALMDLLGPEAFQSTIAIEKVAGVVLAALCALRWGVRIDLLSPAWGFLVLGIGGLIVGPHPDLTAADSLRSLAGSVAPFAFFFCYPPRAWADRVLTAVRWGPTVAVAVGAMLAVPGVRPLLIEDAGMRLAGLGHPAFLASVTLVAVYACLIELFRSGAARWLWLLAWNLGLLLTGARAPLAYAALVITLSLLLVPAPLFPTRRRLSMLLTGGVGMCVLVALSDGLSQFRVFNLLASDATNLSGRDYLWPVFEAVANEAPWFGWGIGSGDVILPPEGRIAKMLRTWAVHNEYLRLRVETGWIGLALIGGLFAAWVRVRASRLPQPDRGVMTLAFVALAAHAITDNFLISTPACLFFIFAAAISARRDSTH